MSPGRGVWVKGVDVWESSRIVSALGVGVADAESSGTGGGGDGEGDSGGPSRAWVATAALVAPGDAVERDLALGKPAFQSLCFFEANIACDTKCALVHKRTHWVAHKPYAPQVCSVSACARSPMQL